MTLPDPVLLLHGQPGSARDWDRVLPHLSGQLTAVALNRPGYDGLTQSGGIEHSARATISYMDAAGIERATIAGLSFGGGVAAWIAEQRAMLHELPQLEDNLDRIEATHVPQIGELILAASTVSVS